MDKKIKAVLFDLDGTLLPMDQEVFTKGYFRFLIKKAAPYGYEPEKLISSIWQGTAAMVKNTGEVSNETVFWRVFAGIYGDGALKDKPVFDEFYANEFNLARDTCGYTPASAEAIKLLKEKGINVALATNPIFPEVATRTRMKWAGVDPDDFALYTTYENINFCKPNLAYYKEVLRRLELDAGDGLMVGNDVGEDMIAEKLGINVFLLTDCVINKSGEDISRYPHGDFGTLTEYLKAL